MEPMEAESKKDVANAKERLLKILTDVDTTKSGTVPRELLERAFLEALQPLNMFPGEPERLGIPQESLTSFIQTTIARFEGETMGRVDYRQMVEWLFADTSDTATGSPGLRDVMKEAKRRHLEREKERRASAAGDRDADQVEDPEPWCITRWLKDNVSEVLSTALVAPLAGEKDPKGMEFAFAQALGKIESDKETSGEDVIFELLQRGNALRKIAQKVAKQAKRLTEAKAATGQEMNSKFASGGAFSFTYGSETDFYTGLEALIGSPDPRVEKTMQEEHCRMADSTKEWTTGNYGITTTPEIEWHFVTLKSEKRDTWRPGGKTDGWTWPAETKNFIQKGELQKEVSVARKSVGLDKFEAKFAGINLELKNMGHEPLVEAEWVGGRLYTGPMFEKYNAVNRGGALESWKQARFMVDKFKELCLENRYTTTIHAINSALIKLSKLEKAVKLYRGTQNGVLPKEFWNDNVAGVRGGIEFGFLSCSKDIGVARQYLQDGKSGVAKAATILEIKTGMIDKGADLSPFSQYPHEQEICFPPLTCLEVLGSRIEDSIMYLEIRLNVNFTALTIDQVIGKRKKVVSDMCKNLQSEVTAALEGQHWLSVVEDKHEARLIHTVIRELTKLKLRKITENQDPQLFNNDEKMLSSVRSALEVTDSVKWLKSGLLREAARLLKDREQLKKQMPHMFEEPPSEIRNKMAERPSYEQLQQKTLVYNGDMASDSQLKAAGHSAELTADENSKIETVAVKDILLKREDTRMLGLTQGSQQAHILESLQLVQEDEKIKVHQPHKLLKGVEAGYILVKVNEKDEQSDAFVQELVNESGATLKFVRPLSKEDLGHSLDIILKNSDEPKPFDISRALALNPHRPRLDLRGKGLSENAGIALASSLKKNLTVADVFITGNNLGPGVAKAFQEMLRSNHTLQTLAIDSNKLGEFGGGLLAEGISGNDTLQTLRIKNNGINERGGLKLAEALGDHCSLKTLGTEWNDMGPEGGKAFARLLSTNNVLQALHIDGNKLGKTGGAEIAKALEENRTLARLWIASNDIGDEGGKAFAKALRKNTTLKHLGIDKNNMGSEAGVEIANALQVNETLEALRIELNDLGPKAGHAFAEALTENKTLITLGICKNSLGSEAVAAIGKSIEVAQNSSLTTLYTADNSIGLDGAKAIATAMQARATLKVLNISDNKIGPSGGKELFGALTKSTGIQTLWLEGNSLCADGGGDLAAALKENKSLEVLGLTKNAVNESVITQIGEALKLNCDSPLQTINLTCEESSEEAIKRGQATLDGIPGKHIKLKYAKPK